MAKRKKDQPCPTCGTCPTCGAAKPVEIVRFVDRPYPVYQFPYVPYVAPIYPQPTWNWPVITCQSSIGAVGNSLGSFTGIGGGALSAGITPTTLRASPVFSALGAGAN